MTLSPDIASWLQKNGYDLPLSFSFNAPGQQALIVAARQGRNDVLHYLLAQGADLNAIDAYGNNALWAACYAESADCISTLLNAGIDINYQNPAGATALTYASSSGKHVVVKQLLQAGADPMLTTDDDFSALDLAATLPCLQLLRQAVKAVRQAG